MGQQLEGMVALVTGGGSGLGRAVADRFVAEGAAVGVVDRDPEKLEALRAAHGDRVCPVLGDVTRQADHHRAVEGVVEAYGRLDALVGMAAIADFALGLDDIAPEQLESSFDEVMAVNVKGYLFAAAAAIPELRKSQGSMTFTLSASAFYPGGGGPLYTISKHAAVGLIRHLAYELAPDVRVNGVSPGGVKGSQLTGPAALGQEGVSIAAMRIDKREELVVSMTPLERMPDDDEYPPIYVLLASREARFATGSVFFWDGGLGLVGHGRDGVRRWGKART